MEIATTAYRASATHGTARFICPHTKVSLPLLRNGR